MSLIAILATQINLAHIRLREKEKLSGCTSYVQRRLHIGYRRAEVILELFEQADIVTGAGPGGVRQWLVDRDEAERRLTGATPLTPPGQEQPLPPEA